MMRQRVPQVGPGVADQLRESRLDSTEAFAGARFRDTTPDPRAREEFDFGDRAAPIAAAQNAGPAALLKVKRHVIA
jgi:hypothetical protein